MKTLPLFLGAGLMCAGLVVGCADSGTDSGQAANDPAPAGTPAAAETVETTWVADANVTQAHLQVTGMT